MNSHEDQNEPVEDSHSPGRHLMQHQVSRRALIRGSGVVGAGLVVGGFFLRKHYVDSAASTTLSAPGSATAVPKGKAVTTGKYLSTSLTSPAITTWKTGTTAPGYIFVDPDAKAFNGLIMDEDGEPVWIQSNGPANVTNLRVKTYQGKPVLTYWTGTVTTSGHGVGYGVILDSRYQVVAEVHAGNGINADLHEFNLTDQGTALLTAYPTIPCDLTSIGGPKDGYIFNCHIQEIDIKTGRVLLDWNALDHIELSDTYLKLTDEAGVDGKTAATAFDPFHLNAVDVGVVDGTLLISARHTHTIYSVDRTSGEVRWRFGGKKNEFTIPAEGAFAWQHDVSHNTDGTITFFDNHERAGTTGASRGMVWNLDEKTHTADLKLTLAYGKNLGTTMGSVQLLPNGNYLVGWGADPTVTEFTSDGTAIYEAQHVGTSSYRAYRQPWTAQPTSPPDIAAIRDATGNTMKVYASWNGATEVSKWRILTGTDAKSLRSTTTVTRTGFETSTQIPVANAVSVQALNAAGDVLATSAVKVPTS